MRSFQLAALSDTLIREAYETHYSQSGADVKSATRSRQPDYLLYGSQLERAGNFRSTTRKPY